MSDEPTPPTPPTQSPVSPAPDSGPVKTGLAVTALVLGIAGFTVCPVVAGVAAIVVGIIALDRITRQPRRYGGRGMAIGGLVCGGASTVLLLPLMVAILLPSLSRARELSKRLVCASNMKGIGFTVLIYMDEYPDQGVPTLDWLIQRGDFTPQQLLCPSSGLGTTNYVFVPRAVGSEDTRAVVLYEPKSNHGDEGGNILFADGHVSFIRVPAYDELIEAISED